MRIAGTVQDSIVDGPGLRFAVFTQGCVHNCKGCHNPETHDISGGEEKSVDEIIADMRKNPLTDGITLSGGEPFLQARDCAALAIAAKSDGLNVWAYSGWTYEQLCGMAQDDADINALLSLIDVLVDGRFEEAKRSLGLRFRGSSNQRLIDMNETRRTGAVAELS